jgi:hypothetical protein
MAECKEHTTEPKQTKYDRFFLVILLEFGVLEKRFQNKQ